MTGSRRRDEANIDFLVASTDVSQGEVMDLDLEAIAKSQNQEAVIKGGIRRFHVSRFERTQIYVYKDKL